MAADCLLALFGHQPDDASDEARAGAILLVDHLGLQDAYVKGVAKMFSAKPSAGPPGRRSRIRR